MYNSINLSYSDLESRLLYIKKCDVFLFLNNDCFLIKKKKLQVLNTFCDAAVAKNHRYVAAAFKFPLIKMSPGFVKKSLVSRSHH